MVFIGKGHIDYEFYGDYVVGKTTKGKQFLIDTEDYDEISKHKWKACSNGAFVTTNGEPYISMHKMIMGDGVYIHENGNKSDNRKENIKPIRKYKNDGYVDMNGYRSIYMPEHPRAYNNGCVYEHVLVAEEILGRPLNRDECVHHIDQNRQNNNIDNLMVFKTSNDHSAYHSGYTAVENDDGTYSCYAGSQLSMCKSNARKIESPFHSAISDLAIVLCPICSVNYKTRDAEMCLDCRRKENARNIPPKTELEEKIFDTPFTRIGEMYGVTDNAVRRWCKKYDLPYRRKDLLK